MYAYCIRRLTIYRSHWLQEIDFVYIIYIYILHIYIYIFIYMYIIYVDWIYCWLIGSLGSRNRFRGYVYITRIDIFILVICIYIYISIYVYVFKHIHMYIYVYNAYINPISYVMNFTPPRQFKILDWDWGCYHVCKFWGIIILFIINNNVYKNTVKQIIREAINKQWKEMAQLN